MLIVMQRRIYVYIAAIALALPAFALANASANMMIISKPIYIKARVLPTHTVVVDNSGNITKIISNTKENVALVKVFEGKTIQANERPMTKELYAQYKQIAANSPHEIGTIYERSGSLGLMNTAPPGPQAITANAPAAKHNFNLLALKAKAF